MIMRRYTKTLIILSFFYIVPLLGNPEKILDPRILILMIAGAIVFLTQPDITAEDAREKKETDRNSVLVILIAATLSQVLPVIEWGYFNQPIGGVTSAVVVSGGLALLVGGIAFRLWAIRVLGRFFTSVVQVKDDHRVVSSGPYALVRHPSYLGAYAAVVGSALVLEAYVGAVAAAVLMLAAYRYRIAAEERTLEDALGDAYRQYSQRTRRLVPYVW